MRLATVLPFSSKLHSLERMTPVAERHRQDSERQICVDEIIRRRQILELFVDAAHHRCGSSSLKNRWDQDERAYERRAFHDRARRTR
jgi:hypothetical protein